MAGNKDDLPSVAEFGQWRAKMARRGVPQVWIDRFLGAGINGRTRGQIDLDLREGYTWGQIGGGAVVIDMLPLVTYLTDQGWRCFSMHGNLVVLIEISGDINTLVITEDELLDCAAHATNTPTALWSDIDDFTVANGYCP